MTTQALVQSKSNYGFAKVASNLGSACQQYRPTGVNNPVSSPYLLGTVQAAIDTAATLTFKTPRARAKPDAFYAAVDASLVAIGDYLLPPASTDVFFVSALGTFTPTRLTLCNGVVSIFRPVIQSAGSGFYGGDVVSSGEETLATTWPCSITQGTKGERGEANLPGDTRLPWFAILMPAIPGLQLRSGDILVDSQATPARYTISSIELTSMGWRLSAALATP